MTLMETLQQANIELAALVVDPSKPDFGPATRNGNPADAKCLEQAFASIRAAILLAPKVTP